MKTKEEILKTTYDRHRTEVTPDGNWAEWEDCREDGTVAMAEEAMQTYSGQQNAELVETLKNLFNSIDRNNAVSQGFWDQYHAAAQVLKSHTNRP